MYVYITSVHKMGILFIKVQVLQLSDKIKTAQQAYHLLVFISTKIIQFGMMPRSWLVLQTCWFANKDMRFYARCPS